jgi:cell wall-associated NlpC family hydrolase
LSSARNLIRALVITGLSIVLVVPAATATAQPSIAELTKRINESSTKLEKVVESYNRLNEEIKATKTSVAQLNARLGPLKEQLERHRAEVAALAAQVYKQGSPSLAATLLRSSDSENLTERLGIIDHLARDRERQIAEFNETQQRYLEEKATLDNTLARQTAQAKELANGKKKIEADLKKLYEMRREAYGSATTPGSSYTGAIPAVSGQAGVAVRFAYNAIGTPYVWAAEGPDGYDCSGLTLAAWRAAGKSLPHNAAMQWDQVAKISRDAIQPGDLIFYSGLGHVGIFVGGGKVIHAPSFGQSVELASVDMMPPYGYGRVR